MKIDYKQLIKLLKKIQSTKISIRKKFSNNLKSITIKKRVN